MKCLEQVKIEIDEGNNNWEEYYWIKNRLKFLHMKTEEGKKLGGKLNHPVQNETVSVANLIKEKVNGESRRIDSLENNGIGTDNPDVHQTIQTFYEELYTLKSHDVTTRNKILNNIHKTITEEMNMKITKKIDEQEILEAINTLQERKSPGIDGIPIEFYLKNLSLLKEEIVKLLNSILKKGQLTGSQKIGILTLIHKGGNRKSLSNWRPITLLCSDYKILAKIITIRLKNILPTVISNEQTGGIQLRNITQNLTTYRNIIEWFSNERCNSKERQRITSKYKLPGAAIACLDFEKTYDMVDRTFLYEVMGKMGLNDCFIKNVQILYENAVSKAYVNRKFGKDIELK